MCSALAKQLKRLLDIYENLDESRQHSIQAVVAMALTIIVVLPVLYIIGAFAAASLNPINWHPAGRLVVAVLTAGACIIVFLGIIRDD